MSYRVFTTKESFLKEVQEFFCSSKKGKDFGEFIKEFEKNLNLLYSGKIINGALFTYDTLKEHIDAKTYKKYKRYSPANTVSYVCHGAFTRGYIKGDTTYICDFFTNNAGFKGYSVWFDYMFGRESPWRDLFDKDMLVYEQDGRKVCMFFKELDSIPNTKLKLLTNFLIANRLKSSWNLAWIFQTLVENYRLPKHLSLWFCTLFQSENISDAKSCYNALAPIGSRRISFSRRYPGDQPFNTKADYNLLKNCSPNLNIVPKTDFSPNPCNYIWDSNSRNYRDFDNFLYGYPYDKCMGRFAPSCTPIKAFIADFNKGTYKVDVAKFIEELNLD